ncbi:MAG: InlB B-repeat-containing protein [Paludibacteraceae bacterium]|nr:InlB B-repeat-containing protein [Paludibacteraceae bacterium]
MKKNFLFVALFFTTFAFGEDISNYATGFENGTIGMNKGTCGSIAESTDDPRTGSKCISTAFNGTDAKYWNPYVTFAVPDGSYFHVIGYAKLKSDDTSNSNNTQAYADARIFKSKLGTQLKLTTLWQRFTASSDKSESDESGAMARFYRKHANTKEVLFDDIVAYVSTNQEADLTAPTKATSASATETEITWTPGIDTNTGVQATLIWKRIDGTADNLQLNNQGIYALTATDGPKVDKSGHWELVKILDGDATSYSESEQFGSLERYAIVHRDLAYNYSEPTYVTTPDLTTKAIFLKPNANWLKDGATFAVYCYGNGEKVYEMTFVPDKCGSNRVYKAEVRARYPKLKFYRMNSSATTIWNQTGELTMPTTEAGAYDKPNNEWNNSDNTHWQNQPLFNCVSGSLHYFAGEQLELTSTSPGATHYQWYHGGTAESNKIAGATSATYSKVFEFGDAGNYYCKSRMETGTEITIGAFTVKTLRMYFNNDSEHGGTAYDNVDLKNTDPDHNIASGMIILGGPWGYGFNVADGIGNYYGNNGQMTSTNHSNWTMDVKNKDCRIATTPGAFATYTFVVNYSDMTKPVVTAIYPDKQQQAGKVVYFDNTPVNWTNIHYRVGVSYDANGRNGWTTKEEMTLVPGTTNLYQCLTPEKSNIGAWHIGNNCGWEGEGTDRSIFITDTYDSYQITHSIEFEGAAASQAITIIPQSTGTNSADHCTDSRNCKCYFHKYSTETGMLSHNVEIKDPEHGTITVSYTDIDNSGKSFTDGSRDLAHTCILTIVAEPEDGYKFSSLLVNGVSFTSGNTYILTEETTIEAEFEPETYKVTLHTNEGIILFGDVTEYKFGVGATLPTDVIRTGKDFTGWYDNEGLTGTPVTEIPATATGDKEYWAGWKNPPASFQYILGSCYVNKDGMWTAGSDGSISAWRYIEGADVASGTLLATNDISISTTATASQYFNTKDLTKLDTESSWGTSSTSNRTIKAFNVGANKTETFNLGTMEATKIIFYAFPGSNTSYSIDLTVNEKTRTKTFGTSQQGKWHRYQFRGSFTGEFSIKSNSQATRVVVVVEIPKVTVSFDKNHADATGTMAQQDVLKDYAETLKENEFENDEYFFLGWTEDAGGSGTLILDGAKYTASEDITLYAKWDKKIYSTVHLDAAGAYNHYTSSVVATYKLSMPGITTLPMRAGYVFDGYYDAPNGAGTQYYTGLGASVRTWDKTDSEATLYAKWTLACDLEPALTNTMPIVTVWNGKKVDEGIVKLSYDFDAEGITYSIQSVSPTEPISGCHFELFDDQIHLIGTPSGYTTETTVTVTFTIANDCDPAHTSQPFTSTIRINPASQKPKVAFIITGTKNGTFNEYSEADALACNDLVTYLNGYFDVTYVNGYATQEEDALADYYVQYDLLVITDFLNTQAGYTNALGTLIDKKPILSFEAYVANLPNWHIHSNPATPSPKVQDMKVLCAGHSIFKDAKYNPSDATETKVVNSTDTTVHVLAELSSASKAKGLQGFTIHEAPDFIFLATVKDEANNRDLIVCCERQVVFPARLLIYGINSFEMGNLSKAGKIIMRQMIDYLLMTDETKVADCSLVFDNKEGDHEWSNPGNWAPGYNIIPTPYHPTRIAAECHVNVDNAHAGSVKINKGYDTDHTPVDGKLIIKPTGGLTIAGMVATVNDTRYASPITIKAEDLLIEADENHNGALVYGNKESDVRATVQYYSRGSDAKKTKPIWQYMGIPFQSGKTAIQMFYEAWMCRWASGSTDGLGGLWQWVENDDVLLPFEGYCITQEAAKTYEFAGKLNPPVTTTLLLDNRDDDGYAFAANSWTAPIKIQEMKDEDFVNAERTIYIYHTGTYADWVSNGTPVSSKDGVVATLPGQYAVVPIHSSPYILGADSVIPAMQGFFVKTDPSKEASLKLVYNRVVYDATYFKTSTQPMRAPRINDRPVVMQLTVSGDSYGDRVHLLARNDFSDEFQDGWDGRKIEGDGRAPMLAVVKEAGNMAVAAIPTTDERFLTFRAGEDSIYTFTFDYEGETIYLYDRLAERATEIRTGNTYTFRATNKTAAPRFLITATPPRTPTAVEPVGVDPRGTKAEKIIHEGKLMILYHGAVYDARGTRVTIGKEGAR